MNTESAPLEGSSFTFNPRKIDTEDFLEGQDNPGKEFSIRVIRDVIGDLQTDFQRDGVPEEVLELLERSWLLRLKIGPLKHDKPSPQSKSVVSKILQFDGPADTSSSDSDEVEVEVKDKSNSTAEDDDSDEEPNNGPVNLLNEQYEANDELGLY